MSALLPRAAASADERISHHFFGIGCVAQDLISQRVGEVAESIVEHSQSLLIATRHARNDVPIRTGLLTLLLHVRSRLRRRNRVLPAERCAGGSAAGKFRSAHRTWFALLPECLLQLRAE
jgi:hypothetical protein